VVGGEVVALMDAGMVSMHVWLHAHREGGHRQTAAVHDHDLATDAERATRLRRDVA
jgi:hypothetical protein